MDTPINEITDLEVYKDLLLIADMHRHNRFDPIHFGTWITEGRSLKELMDTKDFSDISIAVSINNTMEQFHSVKYGIRKGTVKELNFILLDFKKDFLEKYPISDHFKKALTEELTEEIVETDFDSIISSTLEDIKELILVKSKEYIRNDNHLHNFESASKISGKHPLEVLDGFLLKHEVSIKDITSDKVKGLDVSAKQVHEKIDDNIIYLLIKKVMLLSK
jgi:hypothetical protein